MGWKYIMLELTLPNSDTTVDFPIIFPDKMVHLEVATVLKLCGPLDGHNVKVVSAGMINALVVDGVGGESETLRIKPRKEDKRTINLYNYQHGIKGL